MEKWYFTFGKGMFLEDVSLANRVVEIEANSYGEAREIMISWFGDKWAFQYDEDEWEELIGKFDYELWTTLREKNKYEILNVEIK